MRIHNSLIHQKKNRIFRQRFTSFKIPRLRDKLNFSKDKLLYKINRAYNYCIPLYLYFLILHSLDSKTSHCEGAYLMQTISKNTWDLRQIVNAWQQFVAFCLTDRNARHSMNSIIKSTICQILYVPSTMRKQRY